MGDTSDDAGGCLYWVLIGAALVVGAGFFVWFRLGPTSPPPAPVVPAPSTRSTTAPRRVTEAELAQAKGIGLSLGVVRRETMTAPDGVQRWTFTVELSNHGEQPIDIRRLSETNTWMQTRVEGGEIISHGAALPVAEEANVTLGKGETHAGTVSFEFPRALTGEGRLVHAEALKDGTPLHIFSAWFPLAEPK